MLYVVLYVYCMCIVCVLCVLFVVCYLIATLTRVYTALNSSGRILTIAPINGPPTMQKIKTRFILGEKQEREREREERKEREKEKERERKREREKEKEREERKTFNGSEIGLHEIFSN